MGLSLLVLILVAGWGAAQMWCVDAERRARSHRMHFWHSHAP